MGYEFGFKQERNKLAETLKTKRGEGVAGKKEAQKILATATQTPGYEQDRTLHRVERKLVSREYGKSSLDAAVEGKASPVPEGWSEEDISNQITDEVRRALDTRLLSEAVSRMRKPSKMARERFWKFRSPLSKTLERYKSTKVDNLLNDLTEGRFLNPHNITHVVDGHTNEHLHAFEPNEIIRIPSGKRFWGSAHGSEYANRMINAIVIFSPHNPAFRRFLEDAVVPDNREAWYSHELISAFMRAEPLPEKEGYGNNWYALWFTKAYQDKLNAGQGSSWFDLADCIIDLRAGKKWTRDYSQQEKEEVQSNIAEYVAGTKAIRDITK